jgi:hypothetical protein
MIPDGYQLGIMGKTKLFKNVIANLCGQLHFHKACWHIMLGNATCSNTAINCAGFYQ